MLSLLLLIPIIGSILLITIPEDTIENKIIMKRITLISMIINFLIIIIYGSGEARLRSALLLFLYTLAGSLFMLLAILQIYSYVGSTDFQIISLSDINLDNQKFL